MQFIYPAQAINIPGVATEATLLLVEANTADTVQELQDVNSELNTQSASLASIDTKLTAPLAVDGPLTDTELRATPVPVSGPLTDAQLRATDVPVSGPVTDAELRATPVPVSAASLPLPSGAATEATLASIDGKVLTDTQLRAAPVPVSGTVTANAGTGTFAVSAASLPLPAGAATEATLAAVQASVDVLNARTAGSLSPVEYDEQVISYVLAGNGIGEIFQIVYKLATVTVLTVTLSYDSSNRVTGVVAS